MYICKLYFSKLYFSNVHCSYEHFPKVHLYFVFPQQAFTPMSGNYPRWWEGLGGTAIILHSLFYCGLASQVFNYLHLLPLKIFIKRWPWWQQGSRKSSPGAEFWPSEMPENGNQWNVHSRKPTQWVSLLSIVLNTT